MPSALLSAAEIYYYVRLTGMLCPFDEKALKPASYEVYIGGQCIWWDERDQRKQVYIGRGDPCILRANSITFVEAEPIFGFRTTSPFGLTFEFRMSIADYFSEPARWWIQVSRVNCLSRYII